MRPLQLHSEIKANASSVLTLLGLSVEPKVLFVSPQKIIMRSFKRSMAKLQTEVVYSESSSDALAKVRAFTYAIVISTDEVDNLNGVGLLEKVKEISPSTKRVLVSGRMDVQETIEAINRVGLFNLVVLPWEPVELRQIVQRACDSFSLQYENANLSKLLSNQANELRSLVGKLETTVQGRTASLLTGLNAALDLRDTETQGHSRRVALYARRLAEELGVSESEAVDIERGALLHDIGKIGVSDTILLKPAKLNEEEWVEMKKHAEHGYKILENIPFLGNARQVVRQHHERFDGKGYPQGLAGKEIILGARIFAVIDTYDAMTSDRPYRKGLPHEVAIDEIRKCSGTQFDPELASVWCRIPKEELLILRQRAEDDVFAGAI
ncbi:MAG: HD domain-containing protein [Deltaproteobacteria bacterium]|nr:HD domain-containing protein [Deltaproteobacteria bacterium]MBN2670539.1 HD domain-containing protein [Deltaproteobacteria bacterium]